MILINLLPQELRVSEKQNVDLPYKHVIIGVFIIVLGITLYNGLVFFNQRGQFNSLKNKWAPLAQNSVQADVLERELNTTVLAERDFYNSFINVDIETAQVMNLVSDYLPEGVWLTQFQFKRNKKEIELVLNGVSESKGSSQLVDIQNFSNSLKDKLEEIILPEGAPAPALPPGGGQVPGVPALIPPTTQMPSQIKILVTVTTSSVKAQTGQERIQFVATLKTAGSGV